MKRIGFYGGSFDPIHFGHINLCLEISENHNLDKVLVCPANISPNKKRDYPPVSAIHRLNMCKLAIEDIKNFELIDNEIKRDGNSYTVDTLNELKMIYPDDEFFLILGLDMYKEFSTWKNPDEILKLAKPLVGARDVDHLDQNLKYFHDFEKGMTKTRLLDISSTQIRKRIQQKNYIRHLLPAKVVDYIYDNRLYLNSL